MSEVSIATTTVQKKERLRQIAIYNQRGMKAYQERIRDWWARAFNTSILERKRLEWVDYLRGIAILLIVYRHVLIGIQRGNIAVPQILVDANMIFYSFRMPLFFILSGIFISKSMAKKSTTELIGIKFEKLFYPYLIWATIQITLQIALSGVTNSNRTFNDYTYIFYQPRTLDQFWYLPALFNTTVLYIVLKAKFRINTGFQLILGLALYFISPYFQSVSMVSDWMAFYFFFALGDAISEVFFKARSQSFFKSPVSLLLIIPIFILAQRYYLQHNLGNLAITNNAHMSRPDYLHHIRDQVDFLFIALIGCLSMFILAFRLQSWNILSFLRILGYHSLYIYVMHVIITAFTRLSLIVFFGITNPVLLLCLSILFGVTLPIMFYNLLIRNNIFWFLFSYHKKRTRAVAPATAVSLDAPVASGV
jgi:fucose 4-O-acetylase-like acetyltransferase